MALSVATTIVEYVNFAAVSCGKKITGSIVVSNGTGTEVILRITSVPQFMFEYKTKVVLDKENVQVEAPSLIMDVEFWRRNYMEAGKGEIRLEVLDAGDPEKVLAFQNYQVHIQPFYHWDVSKYAETMPAFMQPNNDLVGEVLKSAGEHAKALDVRMSGYSSGKREDVFRLSKAIYQALAEMQIHYISYPPSYELAGQKIRIPGEMLKEKLRQGTCLDLAVLFATCLETVGLNALIIVIPGHAFVGVWLEDNKTFPTGLYKEGADVKAQKNKRGGALLPIECTTFTSGANVSFEEAVEIGNKNIEECRYVLDVVASRKENINPVYAYTDTPIYEQKEQKSDKEEDKGTERGPKVSVEAEGEEGSEVTIEVGDEDPEVNVEAEDEEMPEDSQDVDAEEYSEETDDEEWDDSEEDAAEEETEEPEDASNKGEKVPSYDKKFYETADGKESKLHRLQKQAMDISVRNHLLAQKKEVVGLHFSISMQEFWKADHEDTYYFEYAREQLLESGMKEEDIDQMLRRLWIANRQSVAEKGKNILYMAMNELVWTKEGEKNRYHAAMYLCPAEVKKNRRGEFFFTIHKDETFFNPVLKELLFQDYDIDIFKMKDMPGDAYEEQMDFLRYAIEKKANWEVVEGAAHISSYTIPNEAIWRGLQSPELLSNEIIDSILDGAMKWDNKVATCTQIADEHEVFAFQTDSSQSEIIRLASQKKTQVVIGPAGNGKTQTIANILTDEIKRGKNVLFVSEKIAALEVVLNMIKEVGLEKFALYVTDGPKAAKAVKEQIDHTMRFMEQYENMDRFEQDYVKSYKNAAKKITDYHEIMQRRDACGKSLQELIELYEDYRSVPGYLSWEQAGEAMNHEDAETLIEAYAHTLKICGRNNQKYKDYFNYDLSVKEEQDAYYYVDLALKKIQELKYYVCQMQEEMGQSFEQLTEKKLFSNFVLLSTCILRCPEIHKDLRQIEEQLEKKKDIYKEEILDLLEDIAGANTRSRKYRLGKEVLDKKVNEYFGFGFYNNWLRTENIELRRDMILQAGWEDIRLEEDKSSKGKIDTYYDILKNLKEREHDLSLEQKEAFHSVLYGVFCEGKDVYRELAEDIIETFEEFKEARSEAEHLVLCNLKDFKAKYPNVMITDLFSEWKVYKKHSKNLKQYQSLYQEAKEIGLDSILMQIDELLDEGRLKIDMIKKAFEKCWCEYNIERIMEENEAIHTDHVRYRQALIKYCNQEEKIRNQLRGNLVDIQMKRLPKITEGAFDNLEWGRLNKAVRRKGKIMGVRKVFEQSPNFLTKMYPCMLMTPDAVAEFIPENFPAFDMVIIDEGSQMPTYKALIPVSKGKRCLIFGDEMQLTPTKFFQKRFEEEDGYMAPIESILEDAIITGMPKKMLRYHYRSKNENLMAFSNHTYYNGEVVTFPSCNTAISGIEYIYVEDGCYDRGGKKTNLQEAERVISKVREIYEQLPDDTTETVGIITLNAAQRDLIQSRLLSCSSERGAFAKKVDELVYVMNLEACQGKEWDHVLLSFGYGPDKNGHFMNNFGPLGNDDGGNRLNVMITRARKHMYVVTSMKPEMLGTEVSGGAKNLKDFLAFARGNYTFDQRTTNTSTAKTGIHKAVADKLNEYGYEVHTDIGSSKCKIDIAVVSKEDPETYQLGIILDNFNKVRYNVKDKEVICPKILETKGWNIYRLHSIDWYQDSEYEINRILNMLK